MEPIETPAYVNTLKEELASRKRSNPLYSGRAFARDLGVSPGFLHLLFEGKRSLSIKRAVELGRKLVWSEAKIRGFAQMVKFQDADEPADAQYPELVLKELDFSEICDWFFFAIVELTDFIDSRDPKIFARKLGISVVEAEFAIQKLRRTNILFEKNGFLKKVSEDYGIREISSTAIKKHHIQVLNKATDAVANQSLDQREFHSLSLSFDKNQSAEAKKMIRSFAQKFEKRFSDGKKNSVYQLQLSFFQLDRDI